MPGRRDVFALLFLLVLPALLVADERDLLTVIGNAYDQETGHLLYAEHHFCAGDPQLCTVQYRDSHGELIAQKTLDFSPSPIAPALTLVDYRLDQKLRVAKKDPDNLVVDAGFDNYVRSIWEQLDDGEIAHFPFLVAGFSRPLDMRISQVEPLGCGQKQLCLEVRLDSWLMGMLASPIELSYSRETRKLSRFSGVSNVKGPNGESLRVDILYSYGDELLMAGPLHQQSTEYTF